MAAATQVASVPDTSGPSPDTRPPAPRFATRSPPSSRRKVSGPRFDAIKTGRSTAGKLPGRARPPTRAAGRVDWCGARGPPAVRAGRPADRPHLAPMRVVAAPDKLRGTATARDAAAAVARAAAAAGWDCDEMPVADGGEGT